MATATKNGKWTERIGLILQSDRKERERREALVEKTRRELEKRQQCVQDLDDATKAAIADVLAGGASGYGTAEATTVTPDELGMPMEDLREHMSPELKKGICKDYVGAFEKTYAVAEWEREPESFTLLRLIEEAHWDGLTWEYKKGEPFKGWSGLVVAGPDGKRWVVADTASVVVRARGEGA